MSTTFSAIRHFFSKEETPVAPIFHYYLICTYASLMMLVGFLITPFPEVVRGLFAILTSPSHLLTDYIAISNLGSTLINSGLLTLSSALLAKRLGVKMSGPLTAALYTVAGFSFFGKNVFNSIPIMLGVYLYAKWIRKPLSHYILPLLFGTALSPTVSLLTFGLGFPIHLGLLLGCLAGILIGFILPPLSSHFISFHQGFNLYNIGFTAGIIGMFFTALFRLSGLTVNQVTVLSTTNDGFLSILLYTSFFSLFILGLGLNGWKLSGLRSLFQQSGKLVTDYFALSGHAQTLMNMGLLGIAATTYVLAVNGHLSGPILGGIFTVVGFGAFGKHLINTFPIVIGIFLTSFIVKESPGSANVLLTTLFGTTLAPIAGYYGVLAGMIAGALHLALVSNVGFLHGGINLYNNGFSGGFVAALLVPLLDSLHVSRKERQ